MSVLCPNSRLWDRFSFATLPQSLQPHLSWIAWIMDLLLTFNPSLIFCTQKLFVSDICKLRFHLLVLAKDCGPIESPSNGSLFGNLTVYPHQVSFACDEGYILNGSSIRRCTSEGTWSGTPALCEGIWNLEQHFLSQSPCELVRYCGDLIPKNKMLYINNDRTHFTLFVSTTY